MNKELLDIIETYKNVIIPALEKGQIEMSEFLLDTFFQFAHTVYANTNQSKTTSESELISKINQYYSEGNLNGITGIILSFVYSAELALSLQNRIQNMNYIVHSRMGHISNVQKNYYWKISHSYKSSSNFSGKGVVYSAITGNYDTVHDPLVVNPNWDYILFTNNPNVKSNVWKVIQVENPNNLDNVRLARHIKIKGYEYLSNYDYSIWVDGKLQIIGNIEEYININKGDMPIICMPHYINTCVYEEIDLCEKLKKDNSTTMQAQISRYRKEGYPSRFGMIDSCVLVRELKNDKLNSVMNTWWTEVLNGSYRDQLSFNYSFWKEDFIYDTANVFCYHNPYFQLFSHQ